MLSVTYHLVGVDGSGWNFVGAGNVSLASPLRLSKTPTGLGGVPPKHDDDQNVDQAGVTWRASMYDPNIIGLMIRFGPVPAGDAAVAAYLAYRDALGDGRRLGEFHVTGPRRTTFQAWRIAGELPELNLDAAYDCGYVDEGAVALRSDESWWRTVPYEMTFTAAQFPTARIDNVADEDAWAYYELTGPINAPKLGLLTEEVTLPNIAAGQTWKISTDPNDFYIRDHLGVDRSFYGGVLLPGRWYVKAPGSASDISNTNIPVKISGTGTNANTRLKVVLPQMFRSAV